MNKQELIKVIATKTGATQVDTTKFFAALEGTVEENLAKAEKTQITGFLSVKPVYRSARKGYDPLKQVEIAIDPAIGVSIKAGEKLKKIVSELDVAAFKAQEDALAAAKKEAPVKKDTKAKK